jgi:glycosyltransferase involved in cell wall biosynthesis
VITASVDAFSAADRIGAARPPHARGWRDRILYCTGWLSPGLEGTSSEVFGLRRSFPSSWILGLSRSYRVRASIRHRYLGLHVRLYPLYRLIAPLLERRASISHVYGSIGDWHLLRVLRRRPIVMTVAVTANALDPRMYERVRRFVIHGEDTAADLARVGIDPALVQVVRPGIDLERFTPTPPPPLARGDRFRILFATAPTELDGIRARGVDLLLDVADRLPDVDLHLVWRPWPGAQAVVDRFVGSRPRQNVQVTLGAIPDMARRYEACHATVAPFRIREDMKVCPTSLCESLASGRPVIVSSKVGIAALVDAEACGVVADPTVEGLCQAIETLRRGYARLQAGARRTAERHFDGARCAEAYARIYSAVASAHAAVTS